MVSAPYPAPSDAVKGRGDRRGGQRWRAAESRGGDAGERLPIEDPVESGAHQGGGDPVLPRLPPGRLPAGEDPGAGLPRASAKALPSSGSARFGAKFEDAAELPLPHAPPSGAPRGQQAICPCPGPSCACWLSRIMVASW